MTRNNYKPIITATTKQTFFDYVHALSIPEIDYIAIGVQKVAEKNSISLMSLPEWQKHFTENGYAEHDPIRKAVLHTKRNIISFSEIDFIDNFGKDIMKERAKMGIKNGIIFIERFPKFNYMITLGTGFTNFNTFDFISRYYEEIKILNIDLIKLIELDAKKFLNHINSPCVDAK